MDMRGFSQWMAQIDPALLIVLLIVFGVLAAIAVLSMVLVFAGRSRQAELQGRLTQMAESQAAVQARLGELVRTLGQRDVFVAQVA